VSSQKRLLLKKILKKRLNLIIIISINGIGSIELGAPLILYELIKFFEYVIRLGKILKALQELLNLGVVKTKSPFLFFIISGSATFVQIRGCAPGG
jgi:hypothetical protein